MTNFRLHHRAATHYRAGCVFPADDAAHIHIPTGAQGMNTSIQAHRQAAGSQRAGGESSADMRSSAAGTSQ